MICPFFDIPTYFFFVSGVPPLLYYAHIPTIIVSIFVGFYVFWNGRHSLLNKLLFGISFFFSLWAIASLITWTNINSGLILFVWSLFGIFFGFIAILSVYFIYVFLEKRDISYRIKVIFLLLLAPILILSPTQYNLSGFDLTSCDAFRFENAIFQTYYTFLGILAIIWIFILLVRYYHVATRDSKKEIILMGIGIESFLFLFFVSSYLGSYLTTIGVLPDSRLEMYGLFGMTFFIALISYLIVKFKMFDIKLIATQALVWALVIVIGSEFFFVQNDINRILTGVTLVISAWLGFAIVRSVKKETLLREQLQVINTGQKNLIHIMNHQIKGYLGVSKNIFAELLTDDYGKMPAEATDLLQKGLDSANKGQEYVTEVLKGASAETGTIVYEMKSLNFKNLVEGVIAKKQDLINKKGLKLNINIADANYNIIGDGTQLEEVIKNLIDNSIYYTPSGEISIFLKRRADNVVFIIKDTGIGIINEDRPNLFKAGGVGKDSAKINTNSTGYGLAFVKYVVEKHKGRVWFDSEGEGKGSMFYVELPVK